MTWFEDAGQLSTSPWGQPSHMSRADGLLRDYNNKGCWIVKWPVRVTKGTGQSDFFWMDGQPTPHWVLPYAPVCGDPVPSQECSFQCKMEGEGMCHFNIFFYLALWWMLGMNKMDKELGMTSRTLWSKGGGANINVGEYNPSLNSLSTDIAHTMCKTIWWLQKRKERSFLTEEDFEEGWEFLPYIHWKMALWFSTFQRPHLKIYNTH